MNKKRFIVLIGVINILFFLTFFSAQENANVSLESKAAECIQESLELYSELEESNFSILRINDSINEMKSLYEAQIILKEEKKENDFSLILPYCEEIRELRDNAFVSGDELLVLLQFYNDSLNEEMNTSSIDLIIDEIKREIFNERYEKISSLIDSGYEEIVNVKSEHTTLNLFYKTTTRGMKIFLEDNWIYILSVLGVLIFFILIYKAAISKWIIKRKIHYLEIKKQTIKGLIKTLQKNYFEKGTMSERDYTTKTEKFTELIRDLNRQIPLLREAFVKIERKIEKKKGIKTIKHEEKKIVKKELKKHRKK